MSRGADAGFLFLSERSLEGQDQIKLFLNLTERNEEDHESTTDSSSLDFEGFADDELYCDFYLSSGPSLDGGERVDLDEFDELIFEASDSSIYCYPSADFLSPFLSDDDDDPSDGSEAALENLERLTHQLLSRHEVEAQTQALVAAYLPHPLTPAAAIAGTGLLTPEAPLQCGVALQDVTCTLASLSPAPSSPAPRTRALRKAGLLTPPLASTEDLILEIPLDSGGEESEIDIEDGEAPALLPLTPRTPSRGRKRARRFIEEEEEDDDDDELELGLEFELGLEGFDLMTSLARELTAGLVTPPAPKPISPRLPLTPAGTPPLTPNASPATPSRASSPETLLIDDSEDELPGKQLPRVQLRGSRKSQAPSTPCPPRPTEEPQQQGRKGRLRRETNPAPTSLKNGSSSTPLHSATSKPLPSSYFSKPTALPITPCKGGRKRRAWEQEDSDGEIDILGI